MNTSRNPLRLCYNPVSLQVDVIATHKKSLEDLLDGLPLLITPFGSVSYQEHIETEDWVVILRRMWEARKIGTCLFNFLMGDWWNELGKLDMGYGYRSKILKEAAGGNKKLYTQMQNQLKTLGWCAKKWPPEKRRLDKLWKWHMIRNPGQEDDDLYEAPKIHPRELFFPIIGREDSVEQARCVIGYNGATLETINRQTGEVTRVQLDLKVINRTWYQLRNEVDLATENQRERRTVTT